MNTYQISCYGAITLAGSFLFVRILALFVNGTDQSWRTTLFGYLIWAVGLVLCWDLVEREAWPNSIAAIFHYWKDPALAYAIGWLGLHARDHKAQ